MKKRGTSATHLIIREVQGGILIPLPIVALENDESQITKKVENKIIKPPPIANIVEDDNESKSGTKGDADVTALLVHTLNAVGDNELLRDHIVNTLQCTPSE